MKVARKNFVEVQEPLHLYTLNYQHLGVPLKDAQSQCLYQPQSLEVWFNALKQSFNGVIYYCLEVGRGDYKAPKRGLVHAHVVALANDGPEAVRRGGERYKPLKEEADLERVFRYLQKPQEQYTLEAQSDYTSSRIMNRQAPKTRGWLRSQKRRAWNLENSTPIALDHLIYFKH
jgi:hypothetical protein